MLNYLMKPNYHKLEFQRLELGVCNTLLPVVELLSVYIHSIGGRRLRGKATRGELEREMSKFLNDFGGKGKGKAKEKRENQAMDTIPMNLFSECPGASSCMSSRLTFSLKVTA